MINRLLRAVTACSLLTVACVMTVQASPAVPARLQTVPPPQATRHAGVTIVTQLDPTSALTGVALFVRAGLDRQSLRQDGLAALTAAVVLHTPVASGGSLMGAIASNGGSISFAVDGSDVRYYVEGLAANEATLLNLFARTLQKPDFSSATIQAARTDLDERIARDQQNALIVGIQMLNRQFFDEANAGLPQYGTPRSLAQYVPADVRAFYQRAYRRGGVVVSAAGALKGLQGTLETLASAVPQGSSHPVVARVPTLQGSSRELRVHRDVSAPWFVAQYPAPSVGSRDFGAMLVLSAFIDRALAQVAHIPQVVTHTSIDRAVGTIYNFDQRPASLVVYLNGGLGNPTRAFTGALTLVGVIGMTRLHGSIEPYRLAAQGDYASGATTLADRAWIAGIFAMHGDSPDYLNRTLAAIAAVTPADLQRVAKRYLEHPTIALVLPRSGG